MLRERLRRDNEDEIEVDGDVFYLHPMWDPTDKKRMKRSASHIARETAAARNLVGFPAEAVSVAVNDYGDRLILRPNSDTFEVWTGSDGATRDGTVTWFPEFVEVEMEEEEAGEDVRDGDEWEEAGTLQASDLVELQAHIRVQEVLNWPVPRGDRAVLRHRTKDARGVDTGRCRWVAKADDEGKNYIPIWPESRFAEACAGGPWSNTTPERIFLDNWIEQVTPRLVNRKRGLSVFPSLIDGGGLIEPNAFLVELLRVLKE